MLPPDRTGIANVSEEARQFQFLSFYQKDIALYFYHSLERRAKDFCPDSELPAVFKVGWGAAWSAGVLAGWVGAVGRRCSYSHGRSHAVIRV